MVSHVASLFMFLILIQVSYIKRMNLYNEDACWKQGTIAAIITFSGTPSTKTLSVANRNTQALNTVLASLKPGDVLQFPENQLFYLNGGVVASGLSNITIKFASTGTLLFQDDRGAWPKGNNSNSIIDAITLSNLENVVITSTKGSNGPRALIDGNGGEWWGYIKYALHPSYHRPKIMVLPRSSNLIVEHLFLKDSAYWTFWAPNSAGLVVRHVSVSVTRSLDHKDGHNFYQLGAFETDGIDFTGKNIHVHDCDIWSQDDCIAAKGSVENVLVERISCSGLGLAVGSIGLNYARNITFRDSVCPNSRKGIYLKTRYMTEPRDPTTGIFDVLYQNITITNSEQFAIWIGPAQQSGQPCNPIWPAPFMKCRMLSHQTWSNIVLKDIKIINPKKYIGVIMGNSEFPMQGITFDNVVVQRQSWFKRIVFGKSFHKCENAHGKAINGDSKRIAPCLT